MSGSPIGYRVVKRFDPASESWFWEFTGLRSVVEVVGWTARTTRRSTWS
jgi:hypothetical protein